MFIPNLMEMNILKNKKNKLPTYRLSTKIRSRVTANMNIFKDGLTYIRGGIRAEKITCPEARDNQKIHQDNLDI